MEWLRVADTQVGKYYILIYLVYATRNWRSKPTFPPAFDDLITCTLGAKAVCSVAEVEGRSE